MFDVHDTHCVRPQLCNITGSTGAAGPRLFTIHQVDTNTDNLPKAHTW